MYRSDDAENPIVVELTNGTPEEGHVKGTISSDSRNFTFDITKPVTEIKIFAVYPAVCSNENPGTSSIDVQITEEQDGTFASANISASGSWDGQKGL